MVSGYLRLENASWGPMHEFNESFILIPNRDKLTHRKGPNSVKPSWLIQSQNFRHVVSHEDTADLEPTMDLDDGNEV